MKARIGVFDSGVGGLSVATTIRQVLPNHEVILIEDKKNLPYGNKTPQQLLKLVEPLLNKLSKECEVIVIACNTVSTTLITELRSKFPLPLIAMEPMIKPAADLTKTGTIVVCATPTTLISQRYQWLKNNYAKNLKVIEPDCSDWSYMIENNQVDQEKIKHSVTPALNQKADVVVLGCTHYHWIEDLIKEIVKTKAIVLQPEEQVIKQLKQVLGRLS